MADRWWQIDRWGDGGQASAKDHRRWAFALAAAFGGVLGTFFGLYFSLHASLVPWAVITAVAGVASTATATVLLARKQSASLQNPDGHIPQRLARISKTLNESRASLKDATALLEKSTGSLMQVWALIEVLEQEVAGRERALAELNDQISLNERLASDEARKALIQMMDARARHITRVAWIQGAVFALLGIAVSVLGIILAMR
jgi:hypothetical protein